MGQDETIAVIGLGKLGLPFACVLAEKGFRVVGIDSASAVCNSVNSRCYTGHEPEVARLLASAGDSFHAAVDFRAATQADIAFVIVPTPSDARDQFDLRFVRQAIKRLVTAVLEAGKERYTITLVSTVMPGACSDELVPLLRSLTEHSETTIDLVYSPEFIALGQVVQGLLQPDLILVGSNEPAAAKKVADFYLTMAENRPRVMLTNFVNAELAKLAINSKAREFDSRFQSFLFLSS